MQLMDRDHYWDLETGAWVHASTGEVFLAAARRDELPRAAEARVLVTA